MCGISGVFEYGGNRAVDPARFMTMLDVIEHRGPDDDGHYIEETLAIGMRRLSIIDLAGGQQPVFNEDGNVLVVYNGEIYNFLALKKELEAKGHLFKTNCDTEVLVHLYEEEGPDCVKKLRGMFAFAIWDKTKRQLFIARDRLGIKPLHYTIVDGCLVFGSEIKSILQHDKVHASLNLEALSHYVSLKYVPAPLTMFEGISLLPPGHVMLCSEDGVRTWAYWDITFTQNKRNNISENEAAEELEALLRESVKMRLMSDVPYGAFLSGGVDSSTIVALMSQFLNEPVKTFAVGYEDKWSDVSELSYARIVADHCQTDHHEIICTAQDFINYAEDVVWHLDQPIADQAVMAVYMVSKYASNHVKMVLTGEGGDELFAGYGRYIGNRFSPLFQPIPKPIRQVICKISQRLPGFRRAKLGMYALCQDDEISRLLNWFPLFNDSEKAGLLSSSTKTTLGDISSRRVFEDCLAHSDAPDALSRLQYIDQKLWLPDDLLLRGDKMTMAASIEGRVPILDHNVVEFAASLPPHLRLHGIQRKYLLKKVSRKLLPGIIVDRKKKGFPMPTSAWFREEANEYMRDMLSETTIKRRGIFDPQYVGQMLTNHEAHFADHGNSIWSLLNVELWHRRFIDN